MKKLLSVATKSTILAGIEIMKQYENGFKTITKPDGSPVTSADLAAHDILFEHLNKTGITVISEEGEFYDNDFRQSNDYWCLDPIDGTRDYVNKTGEFCISVGLIKDKTAKLGVLYSPALDLFYFGAEGIPSRKFNGSRNDLEKLLDNSDFFEALIHNSTELPTHDKPENPIFLTSRFHKDNITELYIEKLREKSSDLEVITMGCAIKLGVVAERKATEYTRFGTVNFWDIAGGHAIAKYAGLQVNKPDSSEEIDYSNEEMKVKGYSIKW